MSEMPSATDRMRQRAEEAERELDSLRAYVASTSTPESEQLTALRHRAERAESHTVELRRRIAQLGTDYAAAQTERQRLADDLRAVTAVLDAMLEEMGGLSVPELQAWTELDGCDEPARIARLETALMCILSVWDSRRRQPRRPQSEPAQPAQRETG